MNNLYKIFKKQHGVGLVETIFAIGIAVVVMTSLVSLALVSLRTSQKNTSLLRQSKLASEELERIRTYKLTRDWKDFVDDMRNCTGTSYCYIAPDLVLHIDLVPPYGESLEAFGDANIYRYFKAYDPAAVSYPVTSDSALIIDPGTTPDLLRVSVTVETHVGDDVVSAHTHTDISNWTR
ncbi:hypothetical protein KC980_00555 [candidate division WWE3 bacterium]|uniref:Uncharacterized protein n=1 Tax=candidate division WWE3 bacterium TaxID=2053526 RepID=A0A955J232_UNCKA|nr:hypothetical protein [candidate division WWE3 bacterium]